MPFQHVVGINAQAEEVCRDKPQLRGANADHANNEAIDGGDDPALPSASSDHQCGGDGQDAGEIVESKDLLKRKLWHLSLILQKSR